MANTSRLDVWELYNKATKIFPEPNRSEYTKYFADIMSECIRWGESQGRTTNALGKMKGDWFEMICKTIFEKELGRDNITMHIGDNKNHKINEINGFKHVSWITYPDAILIDEHRLKAAVSIKWGMRHDRMYEPLYAAMAMKDIMMKLDQPFNFYLLTNDDSSARLRVMLEAPMLDGIYHIDPTQIHATDDRQGNVLRRLKGFNDLITQLRLLI